MDKKEEKSRSNLTKNLQFLPNIFLPQILSQSCTTYTNTIQTLLNRGKSPFTPKLEIIFWKSFEFTKNYNDFNFIFFWKPSTVAAASGAGVGKSRSASKAQSFIHAGSAISNKEVKKNVSFSCTKKNKWSLKIFLFSNQYLKDIGCTKLMGNKALFGRKNIKKTRVTTTNLSANSSLIWIKYNRQWERWFSD